ncbi:MAG TPA: phenylalanine--tRNA ligase subunit alpha, partial [Planctomycetaceae bacterium]|nr:phenylalanine--tRNA ligase subunit alpha [Planctomycetaceae bacterium]
MSPLQQLDQFEALALAALESAKDAAAVEAARVEFLGKKSGRIKALQELLGKATPEQRPALGAKFNDVRQRVTAALEARQQELAQPKAALTAIDISLPGEPVRLGRRHPLT